MICASIVYVQRERQTMPCLVLPHGPEIVIYIYSHTILHALSSHSAPEKTEVTTLGVAQSSLLVMYLRGLLVRNAHPSFCSASTQSNPGLSVVRFGSIRGCHCARKVIAVALLERSGNVSRGFVNSKVEDRVSERLQRRLSERKGKGLLTPHRVAADECQD